MKPCSPHSLFPLAAALAAFAVITSNVTANAAPMDATTLADFDFSAAQQTRTQTLIDNGTLELQRILTGPASGYRHMGWPVATRLPASDTAPARTVVLIRHLRDHSAYASYPDNARRVIWSDDNMATWLPADALTAPPPFGRNLDDTPTNYDYQGMHAISWAFTGADAAATTTATSGTARLVAVTAQQDTNNKTPRARVYLSDDRGATWREQPDALAAMPAAAVHSGPNMVRHPEFGLVVPFGQTTTSGSNQPNFLARSADAGETWEMRTWLNATATRNVEPSLATWGPGHMVIIGRDYNEATGYDAASGKYYYTQNVYKHTPGAPFSAVTFATARTNIAGNGATAKDKGKNAREAHDTADVIYNPVTGRIEMIQSSRWGNGAENPLPADPTNVDTVNNSLNIWSIDPVDLLNGGTTWRFDGNLVERQGIILGGAAGTFGAKGNKDGYHPGGSIIDEAAGKQHIFIYVGIYTQYANAYRLSRPLDTYAFRAACGLPVFPAPAITGIADVDADNLITITGSHFADLKEVLVAGKPATIASATATEIKFPLPVSVNAGDRIAVRTDNGLVSAAVTFTHVAPVVTSVTYDIIWPGKTVTITGSNFADVTKVLFGDVAATGFVTKTDTQIVVTVPEGVTGGVIFVQAPGGTVTAPDGGAYLAGVKPFDLAELVSTQPAVIGYHPVDFVASASGTPAPTYKWQYRKSDSDAWTDIAGSSDYEGVSTSHLTIVNTTGKNGWQYRYVATNNTEDVYSNAATLQLLAEALPAPAGITAVSGTVNPDLYVSDIQKHAILKITQADQKVLAFAGQPGVSGTADGASAQAQFNTPRGLAIDTTGALLVADTGNSLIRAIANGNVVTGATALNKPRAVAAHDANGDIYVADTASHLIRKIAGDGTMSIVAGAGVAGYANGAGPAAQFRSPSGIAVDAAGNLYVADTGNHAIRYIIVGTGSVTTFAGSTTSGVTDGTRTSARFKSPEGVAVDANGDVFVADTGNSLIREIHSGTVSTIAGQRSGIAGFKDGGGTNAWFDNPTSLVVAEDGNLYVADTGNAAIRRITSTNEVTTLTLEALFGTSGNGGGENGGGGGGGGAFGWWYAAALAVFLITRAFVAKTRQ